MTLVDRFRAIKTQQFFGVLFKASPRLATAWWAVLVLRGLLPTLFAIAMGVLIGAVQHGHSVTLPLATVGR